MAIIEHIDLDLAWEKTKSNLRDNSRIFVNNPYVIDVLDSDLDSWKGHLEEQFEGEYYPEDAKIVDVPKAGWNIRPGNALSIVDLVMYSGLVLNFYETIKSEIEWSAESQRFSRILLDDKSDRGWIESPSLMWEEFNDRQRELLSDHSFVVFTDVAGYFENIERRLLYSDLNSMGVQEEPLQELMGGIKRWENGIGRGLPQGYYPSDILSEVYFNKIDLRLKSQGFEHVRYSDNLSIFTETKLEAKRALQTLTNLYRQRGLNLQRHKTEIVYRDVAEEKLLEPDREIERIKDDVGGRIKRGEGGDPYAGGSGGKSTGNPYADGGERLGRDVLEEEVDQNILEETFSHSFENSEGGFNQHLFRFLITRLGLVDNDAAVPYCLNRIKNGKTEVKHILDRYFSRLPNKKELVEILAEMIDDGEIIYDYHEFLLIRWFWEIQIESEAALRVIRNSILPGDSLIETKNYAMAYLGKFGDVADMDRILERYPETSDPIAQLVIINAIMNMESSQRNGFYNSVRNDSIYSELAVSYAKSASEN